MAEFECRLKKYRLDAKDFDAGTAGRNGGGAQGNDNKKRLRKRSIIHQLKLAIDISRAV